MHCHFVISETCALYRKKTEAQTGRDRERGKPMCQNPDLKKNWIFQSHFSVSKKDPLKELCWKSPFNFPKQMKKKYKLFYTPKTADY